MKAYTLGLAILLFFSYQIEDSNGPMLLYISNISRKQKSLSNV